MGDTGSRFTERYALELRLGAYSLLLACVLATGLFVALRLRDSYQVAEQVAVIAARQQQVVADQQAFREQVLAEIDALKVTAYGPLSARDRRRLVTEEWSVNRDGELRARIAATERRLFQLEAQIQALGRQGSAP